MKLYIVVRQDLSPGAQIAQSIHAFREFVEDHYETEAEWYSKSNTIVVLGVENLRHLHMLSNEAFRRGFHRSEFREPDMSMELTAICLEPTPEVSQFLSSLPLAGASASRKSS